MVEFGAASVLISGSVVVLVKLWSPQLHNLHDLAIPYRFPDPPSPDLCRWSLVPSRVPKMVRFSSEMRMLVNIDFMISGSASKIAPQMQIKSWLLSMVRASMVVAHQSISAQSLIPSRSSTLSIPTSDSRISLPGDPPNTSDVSSSGFRLNSFNRLAGVTLSSTTFPSSSKSRLTKAVIHHCCLEVSI